MAELGIIAAADMTSIAKLILIQRVVEDARLRVAARAALLQMIAGKCKAIGVANT